jgi:uncharacterized Fe-S radical SAM superfamily protein PflX
VKGNFMHATTVCQKCLLNIVEEKIMDLDQKDELHIRVMVEPTDIECRCTQPILPYAGYNLEEQHGTSSRKK